MTRILTPIPLDKFPETTRRFVEPSAPHRVKVMVADGLVPMKPIIQVCCLYQFGVGDHSELTEKAIESLRRLPSSTLIDVAKSPLLGNVLHWMCEHLRDLREVVRTILTNQKTPIETLIMVAKSADEDTCELIARNQIRLMESTTLVETLFLNPNMRSSSVDRMLDFAARNEMKLENIPGYDEMLADFIGRELPSEDEAAQNDEIFRTLVDEAQRENQESQAAQTPTVAKSFAVAQEEEPPKRRGSAAGRIRELNVAQKVRLAMMGSPTERGILIKDTNKVVARTVIRSPAVSDSEVISYSKNKALLDEVITYIANNKKWTRHYQVKKNLAMNPKTPMTTAMRFLTHLRTPDLRLIAKSRDIPSSVANAARNLVKARLEK